MPHMLHAIVSTFPPRNHLAPVFPSNLLTYTSCSLACFQTHKITHPAPELAPPKPVAPEMPQPPVPPPPPKYLRQKIDFSILATKPKFQELLKTQPALFPALQNIYAATIEPDGGGRAPSHYRGGRGRGRGGEGRWTQKQGDFQAMKMLKWMREGDRGDKTQDAITEFVALVDELVGRGKQEDG